MITEDYVSLEVAKLLKEKGFNEPTWTRYEDGNEVIFGDKYDWNNSPMGQTSAPTLQMAMKWLRETFNIHIVPKRDFYGGFYTGRIYDGRRELTADKEDYIACAGYGTYEEAANVAIKFCLEKMI